MSKTPNLLPPVKTSSEGSVSSDPLKALRIVILIAKGNRMNPLHTSQSES